MDSDKELFESAMAPEPVEEVAATPEPIQDERGNLHEPATGKFIPKAKEEAEPVAAEAEPEPAKVEAKETEEAAVPSWRVRELREERDAFKRERDQQAAEFQRRMAEFQRPAPQPQPKPDLYENPDAFVEHGVRQFVDPVREQFGQLKELYSKKDAIRTHGEEKVKAAYDAIAQGIAQRDPEVLATYQRAMNSMDPYEDIVTWHQQKTVFSQIGSDPEAWFEKRLAERLKDPAFQAKQLQTIQSQPSTQRQNVIQLPPSLNKATGSHVTDDEQDANDMSDGALAKHAFAPMRRR